MLNINNTLLADKVVLITGAAKRIGSIIAKTLHQAGMTIIIHYNNSSKAAKQLQIELEQYRQDSVFLIQGDLLDIKIFNKLISPLIEKLGRLDILINNASSFYPTPIADINESVWDDLIGINLKAPLFLIKELNRYLQETKGCIINIADIYADIPLNNYPIYSISQAGLVMLTKSLAQELSPNVRVNAIAPGAILWPESGQYNSSVIINATALKRLGEPLDIAKAIVYLAIEAQYTTGQILTIDGGRTLSN